MAVRAVVAFFIGCDWPDCDAEEVFDPPKEHAFAAARGMGWTVTDGKGNGTSRKARCPDHRNRHLALLSEGEPGA